MKDKIYSPTVHVVMFGLLLVFTPFIMLQNYLQTSIKELSNFKIALFGLRLPLMFTIFVIIFASFLIAFRKKITLYRTVAVAVCIAMIALGQQISDYYMANPFYDLQNNWHYIAYAIFAVLMFRMLKARGKDTGYIVRTTYFSALTLSAFDEGFQFFLSSRVFDISDIAKDGWGVLIGLIICLFVYEEGRFLRKSEWRIAQKKIGDYLRIPLSFMVLATIFNLLFLIYGSLLSDLQYIGTAMVFLFGSFTILFILIHISQWKTPRRALLGILILSLISLMISFSIHRKEYIIHNSSGLIVYKGLPLPYFDIMIFPKGGFRLVDKKLYFFPGDKTTIFEHKADIVIIGTGADGKGGGGFGSEISAFAYNPITNKCSQIIVLPNKSACENYNRLKKEGKNVLFIIHNT
ncbi:MAG: VanZ family protein [bacterium]